MLRNANYTHDMSLGMTPTYSRLDAMRCFIQVAPRLKLSSKTFVHQKDTVTQLWSRYELYEISLHDHNTIQPTSRLKLHMKPTFRISALISLLRRIVLSPHLDRICRFLICRAASQAARAAPQAQPGSFFAESSPFRPSRAAS